MRGHDDIDVRLENTAVGFIYEGSCPCGAAMAVYSNGRLTHDHPACGNFAAMDAQDYFDAVQAYNGAGSL